MQFPMKLGCDVVAVGVVVPTGDANNRLFTSVLVDNFHISNGRVANEAGALFGEVER